MNAFRALKVKKILGITSGSGGPEMNKVYAKYFEDNGIGVVAMEGMGVEFRSITEVPPATISSFIKKAFAEHKEGHQQRRSREIRLWITCGPSLPRGAFRRRTASGKRLAERLAGCLDGW